MDFMSEMCSIKDKEYFNGNYYSRIPKTTVDKAEPFSYEMIDPKSREYKTIMGNILTEGTYTAIKTRSTIEMKSKGYVVTQDGKLWQIEVISENLQPEQGEQAIRFFIETAQIEKTIRMIGIDNIMELK